MTNHILKSFIIILLLLLVALNSKASVMNLNDNLPTRMEDASVTDLHKIEFQGSALWDEEKDLAIFRPSLRWGVIKRVHLEYFSRHLSGPSSHEKNNGETNLGAQWNFNDQDDWVPSFSLAPNLSLPTGKKADGIDPSLRLNMTYTLIGTLSDPVGQFNINYQWEHNSNKKSGEDKIGKLFIFGYNHRIGNGNALILDFLHEKDFLFRSTKNAMELGFLHEFKKTWLLGIGTSLDIDNGYYSSTLAIQKSF